MKINELIFGAPLDPFGEDTKRHIALVAFWLGSDLAPMACPLPATDPKRRS